MNVLLLKQLSRTLHRIEKNSQKNMSCDHLAAFLAPVLLWTHGSELGLDIGKKISLVTFMIKNSPTLFGEDMALDNYKTSLFGLHGETASAPLENLADFGVINEIEQPDNCSHSGLTCPTDNDTVPRSPAAPIVNEGIIDSENLDKIPFINMMAPCGSDMSNEDVHITPPESNEEDITEMSSYPRGLSMAHILGRTLTSICKDGSLPPFLLEMISIICEKGLDEYHLFRKLGTKPFWDLQEKIDTQQKVNLKQESVNVIRAVLKVSLIKILIEYFRKIFEEDNTTLYKDVQKSVEDIKNSSGLQTAVGGRSYR